ncbi:class II peroxidase [Saccharata proteae CBS 121410]|uniref:Peroxidase n=1 Tax=Saccharata proteae CBS 121410 TaxID=1314787 RepID=A0A9P4HRV9_9PEZI|nr:class II peroxidase [Saccharata proteae CBS 121410]
MYTTQTLFLLGVAASAQAFSFPDASSLKRDISLPDVSALKRGVIDYFNPRAACPSVWNDVVSTLRDDFLSSDGQCTDDARAVIRLAFHDCFSGEGCDGSIILAKEYERPENTPLADIAEKIGAWVTQFNVGTADMIQFAAAQAIATCPLGPRVAAYVGRTDSSTAAPEGELPSPFASADTLISQFAAKGFSATDLAALVGAHSTAKQFVTMPETAGEPLDSTPGTWDTEFYSETIAGTAPNSLDSDVNLARDLRTGPQFASFISQGLWAPAFVSAMNKLSTRGNDVSALVDCSSVISAGTSKRDIKAAPIGQKRGTFH